MIETIADLPRNAKIAWSIVALLVLTVLWSMAASIAMLLYMHRWPAHWPWTAPLIEWWRYNAWYPDPRKPAAVNAVVTRGLHLSAAISTGVPLLLAGGFVAQHFAPRIAHDNARWARWRDLRRAGFSSRAGLYLGRVRGRFLRLGDGKRRKHMAIYAPTQSGKGVSFVIPAALCDRKDRISFVYHDTKFEAFLKTSGWQAALGAKVVLFAPLHPEGTTARYNPCAYVRRDAEGRPTVDTWGDIEDIVHAIIPKPKQDGAKDIWNNTARIALTAVLAFLSETPSRAFTLPAAVKLLCQTGWHADVRATIEKAAKGKHPYSEPCVANMAQFMDGNADFLDGVKKTITSYLGIMSNPRVAAALSGNDFDLRAVTRERMAIYVGVSPPDASKLEPIVSLFFQQLVDLGMRTPPGTDPTIRYECNVVMDEFVRMGYNPKIASAFADIAAYGFRLIPVIQTPAQLHALYGDAWTRTILDNCKIEVAFGTDNPAVCAEISKRLGTVRGVRRGGSSGGTGLFNWRSSEGAMERPLLSPYQVENLPDDKAIILHGNMPGVLATRIRYYDQAPFKRRVLPPVVVPAIAVDLRYDDGSFFAKAPEPKPAGPKSGKGSAAKAAPQPAAKPTAFTVAQAEKLLTAATGGKVDLSAFGQSDAAARAQVDRVLHNLPTKGRAP